MTNRSPQHSAERRLAKLVPDRETRNELDIEAENIVIQGKVAQLLHDGAFITDADLGKVYVEQLLPEKQFELAARLLNLWPRP